MALLLPFLVLPFLSFGYSIIQVFSKNRKHTLALYSLGCLAYFMLIYLIWSLAEISKARIPKTVQSTLKIAEAKRLSKMKAKSHLGVMSYFNSSFFPSQIDLVTFGRSESQSLEKIKENDLCYICSEDIANSFSTNCGHGGICNLCAEELHNFYLECPICAKPVDKVCVYKGSIENRDY